MEVSKKVQHARRRWYGWRKGLLCGAVAFLVVLYYLLPQQQFSPGAILTATPPSPEADGVQPLPLSHDLLHQNGVDASGDARPQESKQSKSQSSRDVTEATVKKSRDSGGEPYADNEELRRAYKRSPCSGLEDVFVGSDPLFPPCVPSVAPGVATWGKYPYLGPFKYIKQSKNPCFYDTADRLRCVPYFFAPGFSKCGTTDFHSRLIAHPQVAAGEKEFMWFSRRRFPEYYHGEFQNFSQYLDNFQNLTRTVENDLNSAGSSKMIIGDYSVAAVNEVFEWPRLAGNEGCSEPRVINANHIKYLNPDIKVIILMRYPVQRLYSRFLFDYKRPTLRDYRTETPISLKLRTPEVFHRLVVDGLQQYQACFHRFSLRHCLYNRSLWESVHGLKIQDSMYAVLLEDWLRVIPRDQILFLRSEDFRLKVAETMKAVFKFLDLDPVSESELQKIAQMRFRTVNRIPVEPMLPETEKLLKQFFQPMIHRGAQLLNDPRFLWEDA